MDRIQRIKKRLFEKDFLSSKEWWGRDETILTNEAVKLYPLVIRKALASEHTLRYMPIEIQPDELVVGSMTMASQGCGREFPQYALPDEKAEGLQSSFTEKSVWGHNPPDYATVLQKGLIGLKDEIQRRQALEMEKDDFDIETINLMGAMLISLTAIQNFAFRFSHLAALRSADEEDPVRKRELMEISRICARVPENPPQSFHEALQAMMLVFCALHSTLEIVPIGRVDQYLYPYYQRDIDSGRIDNMRARELVGCWLAKFSDRIILDPEYFDMSHFNEIDKRFGGNPEVRSSLANDDEGDYNFGTSANNSMINMMLGGVTRDGEDGTNDLTYLILETWAELELVSPVCSVRLHPDAPKALFEKCAAILCRGSGEPALYNDEQIIKGMLDAGVPIEDARDYSNDGCWETLIPGKTTLAFDHVELLEILEYMYTQGYSLVRKQQECDGYDDPLRLTSYEAFYDAFLGHIKDRVYHIIKEKVTYYRARYKIAPSPMISAMMDNCIEKGKDINLDGARYNWFSVMLTGFSNAVDSLAVLKKLVYEEKAVSLEELINAVKNNFEGSEQLLHRVINRVPKFGNDEDEVDEIASKLLKDVEVLAQQAQQECDTSVFRIVLGIATFESYIKFGHKIGASADGRRMSESVSSNFSPSVGQDKNGLTSAIKSGTKPDLLRYFLGCPIDLQVNKNEVKGREGLHRLVGIIRSFMELGGIILTITSTNVEDMIAAQKNPEKYKNLRVRMGGLSAYFVALSKNHQDVMISRTKHGG